MALLASACAQEDLAEVGRAQERGGANPALPDPLEGEVEVPEDYREILPRDAIEPVYDPTFVLPSGVDWPDDELVIGVDLNGEQRAYPVGFLSFREIVIDEHGGIPTMVTW